MERHDSFEDLVCWQKAYSLKTNIRKMILEKLPKSERFELYSQIQRASRSATANIAEGWGRFHYLDSRKFYYNSRGSLAEILDHLLEAKDYGYISEEEYLFLKSETQNAIKVLNGYIKYLKNRTLDKE